MAENFDVEEEESSPLSPDSMALVLGNLFRKESNGDPIDFYIRRTRLLNSQQNPTEFNQKIEELRTQIEECGGCLREEPFSCYSIELVFPEIFDNLDEIDSDLFKANYVDECIKSRELLDLEDFRLGKSPYDGSLNINSIMKGLESWDSAKRSSPLKGRKLPDFGIPLLASPCVGKNYTTGKKSRIEYSTEEDIAILKFLLEKNLYDKVGGNTTWKIVHREFPNHSFQSLQNRFRRMILPNLEKYKGLTESERNLFRGRFVGSSLPTQQAASSSSSTKVTNGSVVASNDGSIIASDDSSEQEKQNHSNVKNVTKPRLMKNLGTKGNYDRQTETCLKKSDKDPSKNNARPSIDSDVESIKETMPLINLQSRVVVEESQLSSNDLEDSECISKQSRSSSSTEPLGKTPTRSQNSTKKTPIGEFTIEEDMGILNYIIDNKRFSEVSGTHKLWVDIKNSVFKESGKNWKSIKRRFQRVIIQDIESEEYGLDRRIARKFRRRPETKKSSTSSEDDSEITFNEHSSDSERKNPKSKSTIPRKSFGQRLYTLEEDKLIINYIIKTERYDEVRGKSLWVDIQDKVLHKFERTWESAKTRFLKSILKDLHKYRLSSNVIEKFQNGLVAERNLGGARREWDRKITRKRVCEVDKESEEEVPAKHPALIAQKQITPGKQQKRQLYKPPVVPLPIVFSPYPGPSVTKNPVGNPCVKRIFTKTTQETKPIETSTSSNVLQAKNQVTTLATPEKMPVSTKGTDDFSLRMEITPTSKAASVAETEITSAKLVASPPKIPVVLPGTTSSLEVSSLANQEKTVLSLPRKLRAAPCIRCSVHITRLTEAELKKYGYDKSLCPVGSSPPADTFSPKTTSPHRPRFTVEISSTHLAARLSAIGSTPGLVDSVSSGASADSPKWLQLSSSLSRQCLSSFRVSEQSSNNDMKHEKSLTTSSSPCLNRVPEDSELMETSSSTMSCETTLKSPIVTTRFSKFKSKLQKDDRSSDGDYQTPNNTDGYQTPDG